VPVVADAEIQHQELPRTFGLDGGTLRQGGIGPLLLLCRRGIVTREVRGHLSFQFLPRLGGHRRIEAQVGHGARHLVQAVAHDRLERLVENVERS
jgi:hypothetical protein